MHPQLQSLLDQFEAASARLHRLVGAHDGAAWSRRPPSGGWSAAECVAHLNLTSEGLLGVLNDGLDRARAVGGTAPARFRRDLIGWLVWRASREGSRMKSRTGALFAPRLAGEIPDFAADFDRYQEAQVACVRSADGLPIQRVTIVSPFDSRVKYSLYSALTILPAHQHRHLAQAERALEATG
jgi:hypothetical protein